jgi:hypothetical protein
MMHTAFEYLPVVSGIFLALSGFRPKRFRLFQFVAASICAGIACAFVAGELVGGLNFVLGSVVRDSVGAACSNAGLSLVIKVLTSGEKAYDDKKG